MPFNEADVIRLTPNVYVWNTYPTASVVVTESGLFALDAPMRPSEAIAWREFMLSKGMPLKYQVVSEHHQDHSATSCYLRPEVIISSEVTREEVPKSIPSVEAALETFREYDTELEDWMASEYELLLPNLTYDRRLTLRFGGKTFVIFRLAGHTRGSTVVHVVEERVALVSDMTVFALHSADVWGWFQSLGVLEALDVDWYVGGHGAPERRERISELRRDLLGFIGAAREMMQTMSREEFLDKGLELYANVSVSPSRITPSRITTRRAMLQRKGLENLYQSLQEHPSGAVFDRRDPDFDVVF